MNIRKDKGEFFIDCDVVGQEYTKGPFKTEAEAKTEGERLWPFVLSQAEKLGAKILHD